MKTGDTVVVHDGSYCLILIGGSLTHLSGNDLLGRKFRVVAMNGAFPTEDHYGKESNNVMLVEDSRPGLVLFTQGRFCQVVARPESMEHEEVSGGQIWSQKEFPNHRRYVSCVPGLLPRVMILLSDPREEGSIVGCKKGDTWCYTAEELQEHFKKYKYTCNGQLKDLLE